MHLFRSENVTEVINSCIPPLDPFPSGMQLLCAPGPLISLTFFSLID